MITDATRVKKYTISAPFTGPWTFTFKFWQKAEITVKVSFATISDVTLVLDTDYSLTAPAAGGTVARLTDWATKWSEAPTRLTIYRTIGFLQGTDYPAPPIRSDQIESDFDRSAAGRSELGETIGRGITFPITDPAGLTYNLPDAATRALQTVICDAEGSIGVGSITSAIVSAIWQTVVDDATIAAGLTTMGFSDYIQTLIGAATAAAARVTLGLTNVQTVTDDDVTLTATGYQVVRVTTSASDRDVNLPAAAGSTGMIVHVVKVDSGAGAVIVDPNGSEVIGESTATTFSLYEEGDWVTLICNGASWDVLGTNGPELKTKDETDATQASPTQYTWYNLGSISLALTAGIWEVEYSAMARVQAAATSNRVETTLSTANNSESDTELTSGFDIVHSGNMAESRQTLRQRKRVLLTGATTYYLNTRTMDGSVTSIILYGAASDTAISHPTLIRARRVG